MIRTDFPSEEELQNSISFKFLKSAIQIYFTPMDNLVNINGTLFIYNDNDYTFVNGYPWEVTIDVSNWVDDSRPYLELLVADWTYGELPKLIFVFMDGEGPYHGTEPLISIEVPIGHLITNPY